LAHVDIVSQPTQSSQRMEALKNNEGQREVSD